MKKFLRTFAMIFTVWLQYTYTDSHGNLWGVFYDDVENCTYQKIQCLVKIDPLISIVSDIVKTLDVADSGKERWAVKIMRDRDVSKVNLKPEIATVEKLTAMPVPFTKFPTDDIRYPAERQVYTITAQVVGFKLETDKDIHMVIRGASGQTMIVEFPDPAQSAKGTHGPECATARATCVKQFGQPKTWRKLHGQITITGTLFFDKLHGQTGVAKNGAEIHPVLAMWVK